MLYDAEQRQEVLDTLNNRVSSIIDISIALSNEGYIPNKSKSVKLSLCSIMIDTFNNIMFFDESYRHKFEDLYNKIISL